MKEQAMKTSRRIGTSRIVLLLCLATAAAVLGYGAHRLLSDTETKLAEKQFEAKSVSAMESAQRIASRLKLGVIALASVVEQTLPDAETWPFVHVNGFEIIARNIVETSSGQSMGFLPIVLPQQLKEFEDYAVNVTMKGEAVTNRMYGLDAEGQRYNETDGSTYWESPYKIFTPFHQHSFSNALFLANYHSIEARGEVVDQVIDCAKRRAQESLEAHSLDPDWKPRECSVLTDIVDLSQKVPIETPSAVLIQPLYPANDPTKMTGFITSAIRWEDTLLDVFSSDVSGVDCVLETETQVFTYEINRGVVTLKGEGDLHDQSFNKFARSVQLTMPGEYRQESPTYRLTAYPNIELFNVYETQNPLIATIGTVCIILFTSLLFITYDCFVRREFHTRDELSKARRQFVRFISHEVRTPLNALCMGLQLLQSEVLDVTGEYVDGEDEETKRRCEEITELGKDILSNAHSAVDVLNDLLNYDKVESGNLRLELTVVPFFEMMERTVSEFAQQARAKGIDLITDYSPLIKQIGHEIAFDVEMRAKDLPVDIKNRKVIGDVSRLSQVIRNLISNALKFTPDDGKIAVRFFCLDLGKEKASEAALYSGDTVRCLTSGTLRVEISDTGPGMTPEQLKNLFKEGVQFDVNQLQAGHGSGLGLYIAKGILLGHGGSLTACSDGPGSGSIFAMTIPLYYIPDAPLTDDEAEPQRRNVQAGTMRSLKVLVVDDVKVNRKLLCRLLEKEGHVCDEAENGRVAVERIREVMSKGGRYDSILLDYEMPEMNGDSAAEALRAMGCNSFIVGITGNLFTEDVERFRRCGANSVLPKPLELRDLMDVWMENGVANNQT